MNIILGNSLEKLKELEDNLVDSIVTDLINMVRVMFTRLKAELKLSVQFPTTDYLHLNKRQWRIL